MKLIVSSLIRFLRYCFYNTPVKHWRITAFLYARVGRLLVGNDPNPIIGLEGIKLKTNGNDAIVTTALVNGNYEPFTLSIFRALIREALGKKTTGQYVFADVGANIGVFTITAAALDPRLKVYAFEPNPTSYQLLQDNIKLNNLENVTSMKTAIGTESGVASLDISSPQAGMHSIYGTGTQRLEIPVISLNEFFTDKDMMPGLIKVDVEGYEPMVLQGMKDFPKNIPPHMILEFNPEHLQRGGKEPVEFLKELTLQFDHIYCLDEIKQLPVRYESKDTSLERNILSVGYNLLLIRGDVPECLK